MSKNDGAGTSGAKGDFGADRDRLATAAGAIAEGLGVSPAVIIKDYWATQALGAIAAQHDVIFKGGTSLSKAWQIIDRYSEDIDLLVIREPDEAKRLREQRLKAVIETGAEALGAHPPIRKDGAEGRNRSSYLTWIPLELQAEGRPTIDDIPIVDGIVQAVLLETRLRDVPAPNAEVDVTSLLAAALSAAGDISTWDDLQPFTVRCLHPGRTTIEKFTIFSEITEDTLDEVEARRIARHLYDVHQLLVHNEVMVVLSDHDEKLRIFEEHRELSIEFKQNLQRPSGGFHELYVFNATDAHNALIAAAIQATLDVYLFGSATAPTWDEIRQRVLDAGARGLL